MGSNIHETGLLRILLSFRLPFFLQLERKPVMKRLQEYFVEKNIQIPRPKLEEFYFLRVLGEGAMGYVWLFSRPIFNLFFS